MHHFCGFAFQGLKRLLDYPSFAFCKDTPLELQLQLTLGQKQKQQFQFLYLSIEILFLTLLLINIRNDSPKTFYKI